MIGFGKESSGGVPMAEANPLENLIEENIVLL